jgi:hypothetical protein
VLLLLQDAVVKGWFRTSREPTQGGTHLRVVALTAYEVASAMSYIHSHGIAHLVSGRLLFVRCVRPGTACGGLLAGMHLTGGALLAASRHPLHVLEGDVFVSQRGLWSVCACRTCLAATCC